jgi:RNA binding exosome subunit
MSDDDSIPADQRNNDLDEVIPEVSNIEERDGNFFMIGDRVRIASKFSLTLLNMRARPNLDSYVGYYGKIIDIIGEGTILMNQSSLENKFSLIIRLDNQQGWYSGETVRIDHHDVVNLTVLGNRVGNRLWDKSKDRNIPFFSEVVEFRHWPQVYDENAFYYATFQEQQELLERKREWEKNNRQYEKFYREKFHNLNRKLRWTVVYNRVKNLEPLDAFDDFD